MSAKPPRIYTCTPFSFHGDVSFYTRATGLLCRSLQALGAESRTVMPPPPREGDLPGAPFMRAPMRKLRSAAWWRAQKLDGVVLTLTEADYSVIHSSNPKRYPPQRVVEELVGIFAEGTRTRDGHVGTFKRGAFKLASELGMPIVPISINGCYEVMSRDSKLVTRHPIRLVVHEPIIPQGNTPEEMERLRKATYDAIVSGLDAQYIS